MMMNDSKPHILLVDDEAAITDNLAPFLTRSGFTVSTAGDGEEALTMVDTESPDLIVSDRRLAVARADLSLRERGAYPDLTAGVGYSRAERFDVGREDFVGGFLEIPLPVIDRNQGAIQSAEYSLS